MSRSHNKADGAHAVDTGGLWCPSFHSSLCACIDEVKLKYTPKLLDFSRQYVCVRLTPFCCLAAQRAACSSSSWVFVHVCVGWIIYEGKHNAVIVISSARCFSSPTAVRTGRERSNPDVEAPERTQLSPAECQIAGDEDYYEAGPPGVGSLTLVWRSPLHISLYADGWLPSWKFALS